MLTGRIVDIYTNIMTVKLFAHTEREDQYAREAIDGLPGDADRRRAVEAPTARWPSSARENAPDIRGRIHDVADIEVPFKMAQMALHLLARLYATDIVSDAREVR